MGLQREVFRSVGTMISHGWSTRSVFSFPCRFFAVAADKSLTSIGFRDWKMLEERFHDSLCSKHHEAVLSWKEYRSIIVNNTSVAVCN